MSIVIKKKPEKLAVAKAKATDANVDVWFAEAVMIGDEIAVLETQRQGKYLSICVETCPFKPGQLLKTTKGLGLNGLRVQNYVVPPVNPGSGPTPENRWAIYTLSYSKAGEITNRFVVITEERYRDQMFGEVTISK